MIYNCLRVIVRAAVSLLYRIRAEGISRFPDKGAVVMCANHTYYKDLLILGSYAPRKINWMAKSELFKIPLFSGLIRRLGAFPVRRGESDRDSVKNVYKVLKSGEPLGIFPEGTRVFDPNNRLPYKRGFVTFAANTGATVLPVAIRYGNGPFGRGRLFCRVAMIFGEPVTFDAERKYERRELDEFAAKITQWINEVIRDD